MKASETKAFYFSKYQRLLLSKKEVAIELRVSESTIDRLRKEKYLKAKMIGGKVFFTIDNVVDYICAD